MNKPVVIIGNGGHASVLVESLLRQNRTIIGFTAPDYQENRFGISYIGTDKDIYSYNKFHIELVLGIGTVSVSTQREKIFNQFKEKGYIFASIIHERAIVSPNAALGEGVQILAGAVIEPFSTIADNTIINTSSSINHDCIIGKNCHIAPGATLLGNVTIGDSTHIGAGSTIIQNVQIGSKVLVGAGSLVLRSINDDTTTFGVPAKEV